MKNKTKKTAVAAEQATVEEITAPKVGKMNTDRDLARATVAQEIARKGTFGKAPKGKTVADLQVAADEAVEKINNGKNGKAAKAASKPGKAEKKAAKKAAKKNSLGDVFGFHVAAVARALGAAGWMPADAITAIHSLVPKASPAGIRTYVQAGKHNLRGEPAKLSASQMKQLKAVVTAAA